MRLRNRAVEALRFGDIQSQYSEEERRQAGNAGEHREPGGDEAKTRASGDVAATGDHECIEADEGEEEDNGKVDEHGMDMLDGNHGMHLRFQAAGGPRVVTAAGSQKGAVAALTRDVRKPAFSDPPADGAAGCFAVRAIRPGEESR